MENNHTVDETMMESALVDAAQAPETGADALSEAINSLSEPAVEAGQQDAGDKAKDAEDKGFRGRLYEYERRGYDRGAREAETKWANERKSYEERIAKYEAEELKREAKAFAAQHNMPENIALEYLTMKKGAGVPVTEQPRDSEGRFVAQPSGDDQAASDVRARAVTLLTQAEAYEKMSDGAVTKDAILDAYQNDSAVRQKVASGEWDFTDVGRHITGGTPRAPKVARSAGNGQIQASYFSNMSDDDFAKFEERIRQGAVFDARR